MIRLGASFRVVSDRWIGSGGNLKPDLSIKSPLDGELSSQAVKSMGRKMSNYPPDQAELRIQLLNFHKWMEQVRRKQESLRLLKAELNALEDVANRDAEDLVDRLSDAGFLDHPVIISPFLSCIASPIDDHIAAHKCIKFKEWAVLGGWDSVGSPFTEKSEPIDPKSAD